jgi:hypothetical protein
VELQRWGTTGWRRTDYGMRLFERVLTGNPALSPSHGWRGVRQTWALRRTRRGREGGQTAGVLKKGGEIGDYEGFVKGVSGLDMKCTLGGLGRWRRRRHCI